MLRFLGFYKKTKRNVLPKTKIGEGSYGCLFLPAFPCEDHDEEEYEGLVSKVLTRSEAKNEFEISKILKLIDVLISGVSGTLSARYKYGVYALDQCHFPLSDPRQIDAFNTTRKTCKGSLFKKGDEEPYDYVIHMEKADGDLEYAFHKKKILSRLPKLNLNIWIDGLLNILNGLENMHKFNVYHFDLKLGNTLYFGNIEAPTSCKIIDFGMSRHIKPLTTFFDMYINKKETPLQFILPWNYHLPCAPLIFIKKMFEEKGGVSEKDSKVLVDETVSIWEFYEKNLINGNYYNFVKHLSKETILHSLYYYKNKESVLDLAKSCDLYGFVLLLDSLYEIPMDSEENKNKLQGILNFMFENALYANITYKYIYVGLKLIKKTLNNVVPFIPKAPKKVKRKNPMSLFGKKSSIEITEGL